MRLFAALVFSCSIALSHCAVPSPSEGKEKCQLQEYMTYEDCVKEAYEEGAKCRLSNASHLKVDIYDICDGYQEKLKRLCSVHCAKVKECEATKVSLTKYCNDKECHGEYGTICLRGTPI
ncbi:hypothetical protein OS493_017197 [Desmophyllum pertusum]|uniref:Secreted protein n=1 Tax=Desmophyllum pertusum TaxID=174260 RepID=A0A9W9YCD9_9CNID|nr:hypothetical protein OS493_017197 [Desmophyllum pertusum]